MIKFILNHIPRPFLQRVAGLVMPLVGLCYKIGRSRTGGVECPVCGARYRRFMPYGYVEVRGNALCPGCLALERHRLLWLWLCRETDLLGGGKPEDGGLRGDAVGYYSHLSSKTGSCKACDGDGRGVYSGVNDEPGDERNAANGRFSRQILHIAPEVCLSERFEKIFPDDAYVTLDLESPLAKVHADVQALPLTDESFDVVMCNHVLEHVADDRLAMREMWRVMKPGGWGVVLSPVDESRAATFEDDTITSVEERTRIFGQYDHRRIYGRDYADRLREAGFEVEQVDYFAALSPEEQRRYGLRKEILYIVRK